MKDLLCDEFQQAVAEYLVRHKSVLDCLSKLQEATARVQRSVAKAVTTCGCVRVAAGKQRIPDGVPVVEWARYVESHVQGHLCEQCRDVLETEVGQALFYLTALLNCFDLNLYDCLIKEHKRLSTLGVFSFS